MTGILIRNNEHTSNEVITFEFYIFKFVNKLKMIFNGK